MISKFRPCLWPAPASTTIIEQTQIYRGQVSLVEAFQREHSVSPVIHCASPHPDKKHTHLHTHKYTFPLPPRRTQDRTPCFLGSLHPYCAHIFLFVLYVQRWGWHAISCVCQLGLQRRLLTDREHCLMLRHRRVIREGFVIFPDIFGHHAPPPPNPAPNSLTCPLLVTIRKHSLHSKETHSD